MNEEVVKVIKDMSRMKYGRDVNVVAEDIRIRSQLEKEEPVEQPQPSAAFPPMF